MKYFFTFFRIFRFEHTKLTYFFVDHNIVETDSLTQISYNQNFRTMAELEYHNVHSNHSFKFLAIAAYFAVMPIILAVDFFVVHCTSFNDRWYVYLSEKIAQRYFFSGPLTLFSLALFPIGVSIILEFRFYSLENDF